MTIGKAGFHSSSSPKIWIFSRGITLIALFGFLLTTASCQSTSDMQQESLPLITQSADLPQQDSVPVRLKGQYVKFNPLPNLKSSNPPWRAGLVFSDETEPNLFLELPRPDGEMEALNGKEVTLSGIFYTEQPLNPDDPPFASRLSGKWIYQVKME